MVVEAHCRVLPSKDDMREALQLNHPSCSTTKEADLMVARIGRPYWRRVLADVKEAVLTVERMYRSSYGLLVDDRMVADPAEKQTCLI